VTNEKSAVNQESNLAGRSVDDFKGKGTQAGGEKWLKNVA